MGLLKRFWKWLDKPQIPACNADYMIMGSGQYEIYGHYTDCPYPWDI